MLQCDTPEPLADRTSDRSGRADARRQHLLETARALFVAHGFHGTGMAQIAAASGIKVGQIYRDFESKEAIIAAIAEADVIAWLEEEVLADAVEAGDAGAIRAWIRRFGGCGSPQETCCLMAEVVAEAGRNARIAAMHRSVDRRVRKSLTAALAALAPAGAAPERVGLIAEFILAMGIGVKTRRVLNPDMAVDALAGVVSAIIDREIAGPAG